MIGTKVLWQGDSEFNKNIKVVKSWGLGTYIQVEGLTQSGGVVESIWKPVVNKVHRLLPIAHNLLILGLGGGTVAKLFRKRYKTMKITGVEIDPLMVELGKRYLELDKYQVNIKIADARDFDTKNFDLIIVDTYIGDNYVHLAWSDPESSQIWVFNRLFYNGKKKEALVFKRRLEKIFKRVEVYYPPANIIIICYNK